MHHCVLWKAEEKSKARGWGVAFGGECRNEYVLRGVMRADNGWFVLRQQRETCLHGERYHRNLDGFEHCAGVVVEDKHEDEDMTTFRVGEAEGKLAMSSDVVSTAMGVFQRTERTLCKSLGSWCTHASNMSQSLGHVLSTALNCSIHSPLSGPSWTTCVHGRPKSCVLLSPSTSLMRVVKPKLRLCVCQVFVGQITKCDHACCQEMRLEMLCISSSRINKKVFKSGSNPKNPKP